MGTPGRERTPDHDSTTRPTPLRVLLVEDHFALADSLELAIELQPDMVCVGLAATVGQALEMAAGMAPDVVLMDVRLPDGDGLEAAARIKAIRPQASVLVLTAYADPGLMVRAAESGASGFLRKETRVSEVLRTMRLAATGELTLDASSLRALMGISEAERRRPSEMPFYGLTPREQEVLTLMASGLGPKRIAARLGIAVSTCRGYVKCVLAKLGVHSQLEAVTVAAREGLLPGSHRGTSVTRRAGEP